MLLFLLLTVDLALLKDHSDEDLLLFLVPFLGLGEGPLSLDLDLPLLLFLLLTA